MNKKISQFELTNQLQDQDLITLVQDGSNKNITGTKLTASLSATFATNERVDELEDEVNTLDSKVDSNYDDLCDKIVKGDEAVTNNLGSTINSYYDVLNNKIITLEIKHDADMSEANGTIQDWIDEIDDKSSLQQLQDALNRLTVAENTITALANLIANGGGTGVTPGFHTQGTSTIFPLDGYYRHNDASPLSTTDTLNQALAKLENQIDAVVDSSGSLPVIKSYENTQSSDGSLYTSLKTDRTFLKKAGDTADGKIVFKQGLQAGEIFRSGWDGQGASLYPAGTKWNMELDNLFVRGNMTVNELTVNEIKAVGGDLLVTLGDMKCTKVETLSDGYKCYFDDEDGTKYNSFVVNDMAICQKFDGKNVKRYWRKVNETGPNYIVLSLDVCEPGSGTPGEGDEILQLGHMIEADPDYNLQMDERRNAIFISAKGQNAPRMTYYKGIDEFTLADDVDKNIIRERVVIGGEQTKFVGTIYQTSNTGVKRVPVYQGKWIAGNTYYYYDQVSHNGSLWICMKPDGTTAEPSDTEDDWQKQVEKGEAGKPSDDVAKWVEITGDRLFLYQTPDDSGTPTPERLILTANTYGMTNPKYLWTKVNDDTEVGTYSTLEIQPGDLGTGNRTMSYRCTVTNEDDAKYYDEIQIAKLFNGAEGADAYYVDLTNGTVVIPFDEYDEPKVTFNDLYTDLYAYHGINPMEITSIDGITTKGTATFHIDTLVGNRVYLDSLETNTAEITLTVTLADGYSINKVWYIGSTKDGETGWNGEDASWAVMSGEQYFHYKSGELIPSPEQITLQIDDKNIVGATYQWYYSLSGAYAWNILNGETTNTLVVRHDSAAMRIGDEVTFKCVVTSDTGVEYYDYLTINKVRDGENVYRGSLQNENVSVVADENGNVSQNNASVAKTTSRLKYGLQEITDYTLSGWATPYAGRGPSLVYNSTKKTLEFPVASTAAFSTDSVTYKIDFSCNVQGVNTIVDTVDFTISKSKQGATGKEGNQEVSIYINSSGKPSRYTGNTLPGGTTGSSWSLDAHYSSSTPTWVSTGTYNPTTGIVVMKPNASYLWSDPIKWSGADGENGYDGADGESPYITTDGYWKYYMSGNWHIGPKAQGPDGSAGPSGPAICYRGIHSSSKTYYWNATRRDVVKYSGSYYIVKSEGSVSGGFSTSKFESMSSFEMVATDLLLAQKASIAGWQFDPTGFIYSQDNNVCLSGANATDVPVIAIGNGFNGTSVNKLAAIKMFKSGTITVGTDNEFSRAGIDGQGTANTSIRFWAGSQFSNRSNAPFRVQQDGTVYATNGHFTGDVTCNSLTVGNRANYGGPGVKCIAFINNSSTGNNANNTLTEVYSVGGVHLSKSGSSSGGYTSFTVSGLQNANYVVVCGSQGTSGLGMRGSYGCESQTISGFKILSIDTDNKSHNLHGNFIAILTY